MSKRKEDDMSSDHPDGDEAAKTAMYLVLEHAVEEPAYSVFRVDASAGAADGSRRARHLIRIPNSQHGMSFAAVHSKRGRSWIVGVGGDTTIYYDPTHDEDRQFQQGPRPMSAKRDPVLISHAGKLYSFSRRYKVDPDAGYEPWFEYLSLGEDRGPGSGFWLDLLPPPFPPFILTPLQYLDPPEIRVLAYAAVGSYILLSLEPGGTFAFHVRKVTWAKVDDNTLPFVGDAVPLGGNYFASRSKASSGATAVFYLKVFDVTSSEPTRLSVVEFPVASQSSQQDVVLGGGQQLLCPLGLGAGGSFCSVDLMSSRHSSSQPGMLKTAQVVVTPCQMNVKEETAELQVLVNDEQRQIYGFCDRTRFLASPMPLVAALSMRNIEEKPRKKKAAPHIFVAPMLTIERSK